jgi:hypothetical protein
MEVLPQALQIIFEVQWKKINEKITRRKKKFQLPNTFCFFLPLLLDPSYFETSDLSYFLFILNDLKCYMSATKVLQINLNSISNRATHKKFFGCLGVSLCIVQ